MSKGKQGEEMTMMQLGLLGFNMVRPVNNSWKITKKGPVANKTVEGDIRALGKNGRSVLVEVKSYNGRLPYSALKKHQREALQEHHDHGGLSLLSWVNWPDIYIMEWPIKGFEPGTSLKPEKAKKASLT